MASQLKTCSFRLPRPLLNRLLNASIFLRSKFPSKNFSEVTTPSALVKLALLVLLREMEKQHNNGEPFPPRARGLVLLQKARKKKRATAG